MGWAETLRLGQEHKGELGPGVDIGNYIASGVVVFNLRTRAVKWKQHLDMSTDHTTFRAYAYSAPTLADLDRDGRLEVILGTSMVCTLLYTYVSYGYWSLCLFSSKLFFDGAEKSSLGW